MKKQYVGIFAFLIISILIFFNNNFPPVRILVYAVQNVFLFPKAALHGAGTFLAGDNSEQIKKLKAENAKLLGKNLEYQKIREDNIALRSQFENAQTQSLRLLPARVIGSLGTFSSPTFLIIDQGQRSGIKTGMAVVSGNNLVGRIVSASESYSKVILPLNSNFSILGRTSENGSLGVIRGQDDFILFDRVSINDKIVSGETLLTKGEIEGSGVGIPNDLIVGKIISVARNESLPFQTAKIGSLISFPRLSTVFIIIGFK